MKGSMRASYDGSDMWRRVKPLDLKCPRRVRGVNIKDRRRNSVIIDRTGSRSSFLSRLDQSILKLFRYTERMDGGRHIKEIYVDTWMGWKEPERES